jgi:hypothetical protein
MMRRPLYALLASLAALALTGAAAQAQNVYFDAPGFLNKPSKPGPPAPKPQPLAWPRLDPGAVLCRTEVDLDRLSANRTGAPGGGPADCRIINQPTAISILDRRSPGRTHVQVTGSDQDGWTDAWLPEKGHSGVAPAASR